MTMKFKPALLAASAALAFPGLAQADETAPPAGQQAKADPGVWRVSTGINVSEGDYGETQKTTVISAPLSLRYKRGGFSIRVSVPYVSIEGPGDLLDTPLGGDAGLDGGSGGSGGGDSGGDNSGSG